jgi:cytochrome c oxidase cbb3-type subunit 3
MAAAGQDKYAVCAGCHGDDGKGMPAASFPDLTDDAWLYGSDTATLKKTIVEGRNGQMPAWSDKLGEQRVKLLAAYVTKLAAGQ